MAVGDSTVHITRLDGGLNQQTKPWLLEAAEAQDLRNWDLEKSGKVGPLAKRNGYAKYNATEISGSAGVNNIYKYVQNDGTEYFLAASDTDIYEAVATVFDGNGIGASLTSDKLVKFKTFQNVVIWCNETDASSKWAGASVSALGGTAPSGTYYIETYYNRLWLARNDAVPSRIWHSALNDEDDWTTALNSGTVDINADDGDVIQGIITQQKRLLIFKRHAIYELTGTEPRNFTWRSLWQGIGCIAPLSIVSIEDTVFFLADDGVYVITADSARPLLATKKVQPIIDAITDKTKCVGGIYKNQYWLGYYVSGSSTNDRALVLNYRKGAWVEYRGHKLNCFYHNQDTQTFYAGDATSGYVYTLDTGTDDDGSDIAVAYKGAAFDFNAPESDKQFGSIYSRFGPTAGSTTTTLNGALTSSATTITVADASSFASAGYIKINDEIIQHTGTTSTTFTGCTRGSINTTAAAHSDTDTVTQIAVVDLDYAVNLADQSDTRKIATESSASLVNDRQRFTQGKNQGRYLEISYSNDSQEDADFYGYSVLSKILEPK